MKEGHLRKTMEDKKLSTHEKALKMNMDSTVHGTLAEIGAGQEVARWFFRVGGASGTIAKTMSAYDMAVSDAIYGPSDRYVSRMRLEAMLDHEYPLLIQRLDEKRGADTRFFAFANTVAARSYTRHEDGHGWVGIRFQSTPRGEPSDIIVHVRMFDTDNAREQEALGLVGVNLIYAANYLSDDPVGVIGSLLDELGSHRIEVDTIKFAGPRFKEVDNRLMTLELVRQGLTEAAMFTAEGEAVQPGEMLFGKPVLIVRGNFRPITNTIVDMINGARELFSDQITDGSEQPVVVTEMTLKNLSGDTGIDPQDFLARAMILESLGYNVLISSLTHYHSVAVYLSHYTHNNVGVVLGVPALLHVFEEKYYEDLDGGILEAFGRLFKARVELLVYPYKDQDTDELVTLANVRVAENLKHLFRHLVDNRLLVPIEDFEESRLNIFPRDVLAMIQADDTAWDSLVPPDVAKLIRSNRYFGCRPKG